MRSPNHIAGGLFVSGFFASLYNVNVFSSQTYIITSLIGSIISDIDNKKSMIGLPLYPLSSYIQLKYGHRTITHSFLFLLLSSSIIYLLFEDKNISLIYFFAFFSHCLFDMLTLKGVLFFYPFSLRPCVIPGNRDYRFKTGTLKVELTFFVIFIFLHFTFIDLYEHGFWVSYNRAFNNLEHTANLFEGQEKLVRVQYDVNINGLRQQGWSYVIFADKGIAVLQEGKEILSLDKTKQSIQINLMKPELTMLRYQLVKKTFSNINDDSLNKLCRDKVITGYIYSNTPFILSTDQIRQETKSINFTRLTNPHFSLIQDTTQLASLRIDKKILEIRLQNILNKQEQINLLQQENLNKLNGLLFSIKKEQNSANRTIIYDSILEIRKVINTKPLLNQDSISALKLQIENVENKISSIKSNRYNGYVEYVFLP